MLTPTMLAGLVSRISYKPGWSFELCRDRVIEDYAWLEIKAQVPDSRNPEQIVEFVMKRSVPEYLPTPAMFLKWIAYTLREAEIHEMREFFRFDGELVDDPPRGGSRMKRIYVVDNDTGELEPDAKDVTDAMAALYDLAIGSMDYGSGFWTYEDAVPVAEMAELMGWKGREGITRYRDQQKFHSEQSVWAKDITGTPSHNIYLYGPEFVHYEVVTRTSADGSTFTGNDLVSNPHEHVYGTTDQCFWPYCKVEREH